MRGCCGRGAGGRQAEEPDAETEAAAEEPDAVAAVEFGAAAVFRLVSRREARAVFLRACLMRWFFR